MNSLKERKLQILLFAQARQLVGRPTVEIPWTDGETVLKLKRELTSHYPALAPLLSKLLVAVNNQFATDDALIRVTDEVACFPPVSGG